MLTPPPIEPTTLALFTAFSIGLTQLIKQEYPHYKNILLYLISSGSFIASMVLFVLIPVEWHPFYLMVLGGITIPGAVGLVKEIRKDGPSSVTVTDAENVNAPKGSSVSVTS